MERAHEIYTFCQSLKLLNGKGSRSSQAISDICRIKYKDPYDQSSTIIKIAIAIIIREH